MIVGSASYTVDEALAAGALELETGAQLGLTVRIIPFEDDGRSCGPVRIGANSIVREGAVICSGCVIGRDTMIGHHVVLRAAVLLGDHSVISHGTCIERGARIGSYVRISALTHITNGCIIEDEVQIGARVVTVNSREMRWVDKVRKEGIGRRPDPPPVFRRGARIGSGSTILSGVNIGERTLVGAGSVVTRDLPPGVVAYGVPAYVQREEPDPGPR